MLGRKQSLRDQIDFGPDEIINESVDIECVNKPWVRKLMRWCSLLSLLSVCANTPKTFQYIPSLRYITFIIDLFITMLFLAEMVAKMRIRGVLKGDAPYLKDHWCQFDASMVFFLCVSVILQIFEIVSVTPQYTYLSILRAPRPLIMVRFIRAFLKFSMPKSRIKQIFKRSSQQIYNVTLFFLFFMSLYGLLGVQLFGELKNHCVLKGTDPKRVTLNSLAIPDTFCSMDRESGYQCPIGMECMKLDLSPYVMGFSGFDAFATSIFTVYQAASQEGWVHIMFRTYDSLASWRAILYFSTMIFFLAWLVKNVFIAVITETFNEIRVQFQEMWGIRGGQITSKNMSEMLIEDEDGWKLVAVDENKHKGWAPEIYQGILRSHWFRHFMMMMILLNGIVTATMSFKHEEDKPRSYYYEPYYKYEVFFTVIFDLEAAFKIWCLGWRGYYKHTYHKFELILCLGTTIHVFPYLDLYLTPLNSFQVLRFVRLIKVSPMLEEFVYKIFGPGKKLGSLILFTMCVLFVSSSISMQLFCYLTDYPKFETFIEAFMSMFQILTQEAWVEVMDETMWRTREQFVPLVAGYFIVFHLFVTLIVLSLFVAVILDNLELDEDIKKLKQVKSREQSAEVKESLPLRLRVFEQFPESPQMATLHNIPSDFVVPKVRESFMRQFVFDENIDAMLPLPAPPMSSHKTSVRRETETGLNFRGKLRSNDDGITEETKSSFNTDESTNRDRLYDTPKCDTTYNKTSCVKTLCKPPRIICVTPAQKLDAIARILEDCNRQPAYVSSATGAGIGKSLHPQGTMIDHKKSVRRSFRNGSIKLKHTYEHLMENGDIGVVVNRANAVRNRPQEIEIKILQAKRQQAENRRRQKEEALRENHPFFDTPLFLIPRECKLRKICQVIVDARYDAKFRDPLTGNERKVSYKSIHNFLSLVTYLDWVMICVTTLSCISMMFETPEYRVMETPALQFGDYMFVIFMSVELSLKIISNGVFFTPKAYLKDIPSMLDVFIYITSLIFLRWMPRNVPQNSLAQFLMILRCLRPLRIFTLVPHMRKVVDELCRGFKEILLVSVLLIVLMFVFACYGVQMYGGRLARCNDPTITARENCTFVFWRRVFVTKMKIEPGPEDPYYPTMLVPRVWANPRRFNFDNIGYAMLTLFEVLSFKGWLDVRDILIKTLGPAHALYIHVYIFLGCMIGLTLFVGVVIANYSENRGTALLTVDQRRWCDLRKRLKIAQPLHLPPRPLDKEYLKIKFLEKYKRITVYDFTQQSKFKRFIAVCVLLNSSLLCVTWKQEYAHTIWLSYLSSFFTLIFVGEVILKIIAFEFSGYWQSRRNRYDLFVTILGVNWVVINTILQNDVSYFIGFMVSILRFFSITGKHATLKMLMLTVGVSVCKSFFIIFGMFLLVFFYALAGSILFGTVKYGEGIGRLANFASPVTAIGMLFRIVTGEDWNKIMHDCMISYPQCMPGNNYWETDCGNFVAALIYFCSFYVIITYIVLNLLVAIIMENFSLFYSNEEDALLSYNDIRIFQNVWNQVDTGQKGVIPVMKVRLVLRLLTGRLQVTDKIVYKHMIYEIEKLHNGDDVSFHDVLNVLSYRSVDIHKSLQYEEYEVRKHFEEMIEEEVAKQTIRNWMENCLKKMRAATSCATATTDTFTNTSFATTPFPTGVVTSVTSPIVASTSSEPSSAQNPFAFLSNNLTTANPANSVTSTAIVTSLSTVTTPTSTVTNSAAFSFTTSAGISGAKLSTAITTSAANDTAGVATTNDAIRYDEQILLKTAEIQETNTAENSTEAIELKSIGRDKISKSNTKDSSSMSRSDSASSNTAKRSDSVNSVTGKKNITSTLSDPTALPDKCITKKTLPRHATTTTTTSSMSKASGSGTQPPNRINRLSPSKVSQAVAEVHDWWIQQLNYDPETGLYNS